MLATDRFGGHIVSGHVDGVGQMVKYEHEGQSIRMTFEAPSALSKYVAAKGSICIDGTSLTVNEVENDLFTVNVIPHTQAETTMKDYKVGHRVNLEVDIIARYLERMREPGDSPLQKINEEYLKDKGFD